jgi:hypothetical protein
MPASAVPPLSIDCIICGNKMVLIGVERRHQQTICTYNTSMSICKNSLSADALE